MKTGIHPNYYSKATTKCMNCGNTFNAGSILEYQEVEICSQCHPFYTGKNTLIDSEGRADKFLKKTDAATGRTKKARSKTSLEDKVNKELAEQFAKDKAKKEAKETKKTA